MNLTELTPAHAILTQEYTEFLRQSGYNNDTFRHVCFIWYLTEKPARQLPGYSLTAEEQRMYEVWPDVPESYYIQNDSGWFFAYNIRSRSWFQFRCAPQAMYPHRPEAYESYEDTIEPECLALLEQFRKQKQDIK